MGGTFSILSKVIGDTMLYRVSSNDGMTAEFSFAKDSVRQWAALQSYDLHAVKFKRDNKSYFFIPGTKMEYYDSIYNEFPCMISEGDIKYGFFPSDSIKSLWWAILPRSRKPL